MNASQQVAGTVRQYEAFRRLSLNVQLPRASARKCPLIGHQQIIGSAQPTMLASQPLQI